MKQLTNEELTKAMSEISKDELLQSLDMISRVLEVSKMKMGFDEEEYLEKLDEIAELQYRLECTVPDLHARVSGKPNPFRETGRHY